MTAQKTAPAICLNPNGGRDRKALTNATLPRHFSLAAISGGDMKAVKQFLLTLGGMLALVAIASVLITIWSFLK